MREPRSSFVSQRHLQVAASSCCRPPEIHLRGWRRPPATSSGQRYRRWGMAERAGRLLVVEDDDELAGALHRGLDAEGFEVTVATDGLEALTLAREHRFDAIVLDLMLPRLNGFRF